MPPQGPEETLPDSGTGSFPFRAPQVLSCASLQQGSPSHPIHPTFGPLAFHATLSTGPAANFSTLPSSSESLPWVPWDPVILFVLKSSACFPFFEVGTIPSQRLRQGPQVACRSHSGHRMPHWTQAPAVPHLFPAEPTQPGQHRPRGLMRLSQGSKPLLLNQPDSCDCAWPPALPRVPRGSRAMEPPFPLPHQETAADTLAP